MAAYKSTMLFDAMNNILVGKSEETYRRHISDPNFKDFKGYNCRRYMTMSPDSEVRRIVLENYAVLERMDDKTLYLWLMKRLPRQKSGFIRYIK